MSCYKLIINTYNHLVDASIKTIKYLIGSYGG
jgi:hypothetical protein